MATNAIMIIDPNEAVQTAQSRKAIVVAMRERVLTANVDYGIIPGTDKPTLLKPGAERLCSALHLDPQFEAVSALERWDADSPLFFYRYRCRLVHIDSGLEVATGIGSCNSMEKKYRWRKGERVCPACGKATIIKGKKEFGGGWLCYGKKGGCGVKFEDDDPVITGQAVGDIPNDDVFSLVNTIDKMAQKRALIAAVLIGANASEFFTQDIEDLPGFEASDVVVGTASNPAQPPANGDKPAQPKGTQRSGKVELNWKRIYDECKPLFGGNAALVQKTINDLKAKGEIPEDINTDALIELLKRKYGNPLLNTVPPQKTDDEAFNEIIGQEDVDLKDIPF